MNRKNIFDLYNEQHATTPQPTNDLPDVVTPNDITPEVVTPETVDNPTPEPVNAPLEVPAGVSTESEEMSNA